MKRYHESLQLVQTLRGIPLKIFILFLLFGGLGALRVEASGQDSLSVERVNKIGAFNEGRLAHDIGLVRFEPSGHPKLETIARHWRGLRSIPFAYISDI